MDCYLCDTPLKPENDSGEHIIPNSIGGIREVRGFICRKCNGAAGETWDNDLAKQLNKLALFFRVVRDRGENRAEVMETSAGEKLIFDKHSLKLFAPEIIKEDRANGVHYQISANDMKQARQIVNGLKRKHPTLDADKILAGATAAPKYPEGYFHFDLDFGGLTVGKSFIKTALALLSANGINPKICERANSYMLEDGEPCFGHYYHKDLLINRPAGVPIHYICVKGTKDARTVQAYLEYFGIVHIVMSLSAEYEGDDFKHSYAIDPTKGSELQVDSDFWFAEPDVRGIYDYHFYDAGVARECLHAVIGPEMQRQQDEHFEEVVAASKLAMEQKFAGRDEVGVDEFLDAYLENLAPYIQHVANTGRTRSK
ncbi:TPA: HNH endonuclease [Pseudomonas aeruginosa]|nr:HNH endonuclease [Pseudomonas aeruginosa]